jgi:hypothetical protein
MKKDFEILENKINELVMRMNNLEVHTKDAVKSMRIELSGLVNEFYSLKNGVDSKSKITDKDIKKIIDLINQFIDNFSLDRFEKEDFYTNEIEDFKLSLDSSVDEVILEVATINVGEYYIKNFIFTYDVFKNALSNSKDTNDLIRFIPEELFDLISEVILKGLRETNTLITLNDFDKSDYQLKISSNKIAVYSINLSSTKLIEAFEKEFNFYRDDIENIIKMYHNFKSEENEQY